MIRKLLVAISMPLLIIFTINLSLAYDTPVHSLINEKTVIPYTVNGIEVWPSQLNSVLKSQLGITKGIDTLIGNDGVIRSIREWIAFGGEAEDYGKKGPKNYISSRAYNHFHNPLSQ